MKKPPLLILAPMDDVTDVVFRRIVRECSPYDAAMTEFVNVDGLQSVGRDRLLPRLRKDSDEDTLIAQVWGKNPDNYREVAKQVVEMGFAGIDINMGCPDKTVVKNGCCSAFILPENRHRAVEVIQAVQEGVEGKIPVSVKTRLGFNEVDYSWHELLLSQKLNMLTIHGRTRKQMSKVPADWEAIAKVRELRDRISPDTLIIGNGGLKTRSEALELVEKHGLDGAMIGTGVFHDPYVFSDSSPWSDMSAADKVNLFKKHVELFSRTWSGGERRYEPLKKFAKIYINDFDGASELRRQIMETQSLAELEGMLSAL